LKYLAIKVSRSIHAMDTLYFKYVSLAVRAFI
jgi:hypothetical protein